MAAAIWDTLRNYLFVLQIQNESSRWKILASSVNIERTQRSRQDAVTSITVSIQKTSQFSFLWGAGIKISPQAKARDWIGQEESLGCVHRNRNMRAACILRVSSVRMQQFKVNHLTTEELTGHKRALFFADGRFLKSKQNRNIRQSCKRMLLVFLKVLLPFFQLPNSSFEENIEA